MPLISCRKETKSAAAGQPAVLREISREKKGEKAINYDSLLQILLPLQKSVTQAPDDPNAMKNLCAAAFDAEERIFYCVGTGAANPTLPPAVQEQGMKRAARLTGKRWALYLNEWRRGNYVNITSPLSGKLSSVGEVVLEKVKGDTLYLLISLPAEGMNIL